MRTLANLLILSAVSIIATSNSFGQFNIGLNFSKVNSRATPSSQMCHSLRQNQIYEFGFVSEKTEKSFGISMYHNFGKLFLMADAHYRELSTKYMIKDFSEDIDMTANIVTQRSSLIHLPLTAGINFKNFKIGGGAYFNYFMDCDRAVSKSYNFKDKERKMDPGMHAFLGYKLANRILVYVSYEKSFTNVGNHFYYDYKPTRVQSSMDNITFGVTVYPLGMN